jgi:hypothetical protein
MQAVSVLRQMQSGGQSEQHTETLMRCGVWLHCGGEKGVGGAWALHVAWRGTMGST